MRLSCSFLLTVFLAACQSLLSAEASTVHQFRKVQLSDAFYSEGASFGDFNNDGSQDVVSGPFWYEGPDFAARHEIYEPTPFDPLQYSDCFLIFTHDFDSDGWTDVLVVGFPGKAAFWYQNPAGNPGRWQRHEVFPFVGNESPVLADITGDDVPELVFNTKTHLGFARFDPEKPTAPWTFFPVSEAGSWGQFTHGLGYGDIDGDGRTDLLTHNGWWEQPASLAKNVAWTLHPLELGPGAQMFAHDLNGDGAADILTALKAHGWGLAWFEQEVGENGPAFHQKTIMGERHRDNRYGVRFSQLHALALSDIDGDGLEDIVTGKRFWAHGPDKDPEPNAPALLYWFKTVRRPDGTVDFLPFLIDNQSGVGTQVVAGDISGNGFPDIVVGNKNGTFVFLNEPVEVSREEWEKAQPRVLKIHQLP